MQQYSLEQKTNNIIYNIGIDPPATGHQGQKMPSIVSHFHCHLAIVHSVYEQSPESRWMQFLIKYNTCLTAYDYYSQFVCLKKSSQIDQDISCTTMVKICIHLLVTDNKPTQLQWDVDDMILCLISQIDQINRWKNCVEKKQINYGYQLVSSNNSFIIKHYLNTIFLSESRCL